MWSPICYENKLEALIILCSKAVIKISLLILQGVTEIGLKDTQCLQ